MKINKEARKISRQLFQSSFSDGRLDHSKVRNIVRSLTAEKPRNYFDILKNYHRLLRLEAEKHHAVIESAAPLSPDVSRRIIQSLKEKYGQDVTTEFKVNRELIGGMRIRIGSDVWDGSVRGRLARLEEQFSRS